MWISVLNVVLGLGVAASWWFKGKGTLPALPTGGGISNIIRIVADLIEKLPHDEGTKTQIADNLMSGLREAETSSLARQLEGKAASRFRSVSGAAFASDALDRRIDQLTTLVETLASKTPLPEKPTGLAAK